MFSIVLDAKVKLSSKWPDVGQTHLTYGAMDQSSVTYKYNSSLSVLRKHKIKSDLKKSIANNVVHTQ